MTEETSILGVDFSGAKADKNTWVTQGILTGGALTISSCESTPRAELVDLLAALPSGSVAALDLPLSVPRLFAGCWLPEAVSMLQHWEAAAAMGIPEFMVLRDNFVAEHGEPLRRGDRYVPECYSCLHKANPNMVPMTFRGMQMLHHLWAAGCQVLPLDCTGRNQTVLLEPMPGAALMAFGLPIQGYKNGKRA